MALFDCVLRLVSTLYVRKFQTYKDFISRNKFPIPKGMYKGKRDSPTTEASGNDSAWRVRPSHSKGL